MPENKSHENSHATDVLLVDDDAALRGLIGVLLDQMGMRSRSARNGVEALEALQEGAPDRFRAVITDIRMPEMGGIELAKRIRKEFPTLPILFVSGYAPSMKEVEDELDEYSDFLKKPFAFDAFSVKLRALLDGNSPVSSRQTDSRGPASAQRMPRNPAR